MQSRNTYSEEVRRQMDFLRNSYGRDMPLFESYIRQEIVIKNNQNNYNFKIVANNNNTDLPEQLLQVTDGFYAMALGFFLSRVDTTKPGKEVLQTYPNSTEFPPVVGPPAFTPGDLEVFYNGRFNISINQTVLYQGGLMKLFRVVNTTLESATNSQSESLVDDGFIQLNPYLRLAGTQKLLVNVEIPSFDGIAIESVTTDVEHRLVMIMLGFSLPNGSDIFYPKKPQAGNAPV